MIYLKGTEKERQKSKKIVYIAPFHLSLDKLSNELFRKVLKVYSQVKTEKINLCTQWEEGRMSVLLLSFTPEKFCFSDPPFPSLCNLEFKIKLNQLYISLRDYKINKRLSLLVELEFGTIKKSKKINIDIHFISADITEATLV